MTVTFAGLSRICIYEADDLYFNLKRTLEKLIQDGADRFLLGGCSDFDKLAAVVLKLLKNKYPHIKTVLVFPHTNLMYLEEFYDLFESPELGKTKSDSIAEVRRNWYMLSKADCLVTNYMPPFDNKPNMYQRMVSYAIKNYKNVKIKNIYQW